MSFKKQQSRPVMNSPADEAEARDRANTAPRAADPAAPCRVETGVSSGSEARPVTATEQLFSNLVNRLRADGMPRLLANEAAEEIERLRTDIERERQSSRTFLARIDELTGKLEAADHHVLILQRQRTAPETSEIPSLPDNPEALKRIVGRHVRWREKAMALLKDAAFLERKPDDFARLIEFIDQSESRLMPAEKTSEPQWPSTPADFVRPAKFFPPEKTKPDLSFVRKVAEALGYTVVPSEKTESRQLSASEERSITKTFMRSPRRVDEKTSGAIKTTCTVCGDEPCPESCPGDGFTRKTSVPLCTHGLSIEVTEEMINSGQSMAQNPGRYCMNCGISLKASEQQCDHCEGRGTIDNKACPVCQPGYV